MYGGIYIKDTEKIRIISKTINPAWELSGLDVAIIEGEKRMIKRNIKPMTPQFWIQDDAILKVNIQL